MMKIFGVLACSAAALVFAAPAAAQDAGTIQVKGFVTGVLPDGEITEVITDGIGLPAGSQVRATDSVVPTVAVEYFLSPQFSLETICCNRRMTCAAPARWRARS